VTRVPKSGRVSYKSRHGETTYYYADELLPFKDPITLRVPAYRPEFVFCFVPGRKAPIIARPEKTFGVLDPAGAAELGRRKKYFHLEIAKMAQHCALLDLVSETERHNHHMADAPETPVAITVDAGMLDRMAIAADQERQARVAAKSEATSPTPSQWKIGPNEALKQLQYAEEDDA
ncbi:MAG: hypothetical protein AAF330_03480, partial [Pseudomonadota bacterium]